MTDERIKRALEVAKESVSNCERYHNGGCILRECFLARALVGSMTTGSVYGALESEIRRLRAEPVRAELERMREALRECEEISHTFCCSASCEEDARNMRCVIRAALSAPVAAPPKETE